MGNGAELEGLIGFFVNTLAIRVLLDGGGDGEAEGAEAGRGRTSRSQRQCGASRRPCWRRRRTRTCPSRRSSTICTSSVMPTSTPSSMSYNTTLTWPLVSC